ARKICISLFYHSYIFIQTINFFLIIMIKVLIVNRCRASGMEGGTPLFHMIPPKPDVSRYSRPKVTSLLPPAVIRASAMH
ncbi:hypothetical protein, partial [Escherichia coli]